MVPRPPTTKTSEESTSISCDAAICTVAVLSASSVCRFRGGSHGKEIEHAESIDCKPIIAMPGLSRHMFFFFSKNVSLTRKSARCCNFYVVRDGHTMPVEEEVVSTWGRILRTTKGIKDGASSRKRSISVR